MADDPADLLPPLPVVQPPAKPRLVCEFCECHLAPNGDVMAVSDRAKAYRDLKDRHEIVKADLAKVLRERDDALAKVRELETKKDKSIFS